MKQRPFTTMFVEGRFICNGKLRPITYKTLRNANGVRIGMTHLAARNYIASQFAWARKCQQADTLFYKMLKIILMQTRL
jgi:hypothetical protein